MPLKVIGAGFGRTGTMSLKLALEQLGFGPCYHMAEVMTRPGHDTMWLALARGEVSDWRPILDGFNATVDWPSTYFWRRLAADNPDAKIILTLRDAEAWYRSAAATIFGRMLEFEALRAETLRAETPRAGRPGGHRSRAPAPYGDGQHHHRARTRSAVPSTRRMPSACSPPITSGSPRSPARAAVGLRDGPRLGAALPLPRRRRARSALSAGQYHRRFRRAVPQAPLGLRPPC